MKEGTRLYINITNKCNTNCPFCCMYSSSENDMFMDFNTFKKIIDGCEGKFELQLEGGEPTIHPNLYLFIEYAINTGRCTKVNLLTNGLLLDKHLKRLVAIHLWYDIPFEIKVSVNYWLIQQNKDHIRKISDYVFSTEYIHDFDIVLNTRKREGDEWIDEEINKFPNLKEINHSFYLQSYGRLTGSKYKQPVIVQNIANWEIYSVDGLCFGQDLVSRSEHEHNISQK